jgi:SPP1 gp7 family putative phage head morphogenesis protein
MSEIELRDAILRHALQLQRLSAGNEQEAARILDALERDLKILLQSQQLSEATKAEVNDLIRQAEKVIHPAYGEIAQVTDTHALAVVVADRTVQAMEDVFPVAIKSVTPERLASLTSDVTIYGAPSSAWWEKQAEDTAFKFAAQVRQGVINGETNEKIVGRVRDLFGYARGNGAMARARTLVHSSVMSAANAARLATFRKNARLIDGVRWLSTLDSATCLVCAALDGASWDLDGEPLKGTTLQFQTPPNHWSCRCVATPIPKSLADFGLDLPEGTRASSEGPVAASTTFADFLSRQSPEFVDEVLGKRRAELFLDGKLTLSDLISGTGRELTLEELQ